jgi:hypothetical protein
MSARTRASVSPRQSPSSPIRASISREGDALLADAVFFAAGRFFAVGVFFVFIVARFFMEGRSFDGALHRAHENRAAPDAQARRFPTAASIADTSKIAKIARPLVVTMIG